MTRDFGIEVDEFVIMPNHLHGILVLNQETKQAVQISNHTLKSGSIGMLMGQYKSQVTRLIRKTAQNSTLQVWHRNYYEHIIRTEKELNSIRRYITENPLRWAEDKYYS